jgi:hypothetical protein
MLQWIAKNKEWLFSGLGLTILAILLWLLKSGYVHWKERRAIRGVGASDVEKQSIQYERIMRRRLVDKLPSFILRAALKPERVASQIHIGLCGESPIALSLNTDVPHIDLYFEITNLSPIDLVLDRLLIEFWFGQPTFTSAILRRYLIPSGEITKNIYFRHALSSPQRNQIENFQKPDQNHGSIHIHLTAYFESALGRVEVSHNIERRNL